MTATASNLIYVTMWEGGTLHKADPASGFTAAGGGTTYRTLCHQLGLDQAAYTEVRRRNGLPSEIVANLPLCGSCQQLEAGLVQPARTPESFLEG